MTRDTRATDPEPTPTHSNLEAQIDSRLHDVSSTQPTGAFLLVVLGEHPGRVFPLNGKSRIIGRGKRADIQLDQQSVSHRHAKIVASGRRHLLLDSGSTNGTYVNDRRVDGEVELSGGDVIRIGETALSYLVTQEEGDLPTVAIEHVPAAILAPPRLPALPASGFAWPARRASNNDIEVRALEEGISLRDVLTRLLVVVAFVRRHMRLFAALTSVPAAVAGASVFALPPPSTAAFEVRLTPKTAQNPVQQFERANVEFFASAEMSFRSPALVRATLEAMGEKTSSQAAIFDARDRLQFDAVALRTYRGAYSDSTPSRAVKFLETHVNLYLDTEIDKTLKVIRAEVEFLGGQLAQNERELQRIETELTAFKQKHIDGLPDLAKEQFTSRLELRTRQTELAGQLERATLELGLARRRVQGEDPMLELKADTSQSYKVALTDVNKKLGEARATGLGGEHPEVKTLQKQASELERLSHEALLSEASSTERRTSPVLKAMRDRVAELEVEKTAAENELGRVSTLLTDVDRVVRALPEVEARYAELTRSYDSTKAIRGKLFEQFKASELQVELERASAAARYEILAAPDIIDRSLRKSAAIRIAIGAFVGFVIALLIAGALELRRYLRQAAS